MTITDQDLDQFLHVDEVGLVYARYGDVIFKSAYTPIVTLAGNRSRLAGVMGGVLALSGGRQLALADAIPADADNLYTALDILPIRNLHHAGLEQYRLILHSRFVSEREWLSAIECRHAAAGVTGDEQVLIHALSCEEAAQLQVISQLSKTLPGTRLALTGFSGSEAELAATIAISPAILAFDETWLERVGASDPTRRLLADFVQRITKTGTMTMIGGIDDAHGLERALQIGASLFHGPYFGAERLAGIPFEQTSLERTRPATGGSVVNIEPLLRYLP